VRLASCAFSVLWLNPTYDAALVRCFRTRVNVSRARVLRDGPAFVRPDTSAPGGW
jgi:hypothetical protein